MSAAEKLAPVADAPPAAPRRGTSALDVLWAIERTNGLDKLDVAVLDKLALRGAGYGPSCPSIADLAAATRLAPSTVHAVLARLRSRGIVHSEARSRRSEEGTERLPSRLRIDPVGLAALGLRSRFRKVENDTAETTDKSETPCHGEPPPRGGEPTPYGGGFKGLEKALKEPEKEGGERRASAPPACEGWEVEQATLPPQALSAWPEVQEPPAPPASELLASDAADLAGDPDNLEKNLAGDVDLPAEVAPEAEALPSSEPEPVSGEVVSDVEPPPASGEVASNAGSPTASDEVGDNSEDIRLEAPTHSFLHHFREAWADQYGCPAPLRRDDLTQASSVVENAQAQTRAYLARCEARGESCGSYLALLDDCLTHWTSAYLARPGRITSQHPTGYLAGRRHPLSCLVQELDVLSTPWAADEQRRLQKATAAKLAQARAEADARLLEASRAKWASRSIPAQPGSLGWVGRSIPANDAPAPRPAPVVRLPLPAAQPSATSTTDAYAARARAALPPEDQATLLSLEALPLDERTTEQKTRISRLLAKALLLAGE